MKKSSQIILAGLILLGCYTNIHSQALRFDGVDDRVNCGNDTTLHISGKHITLEAWINATEWKNNDWNGCIITKDAFDCPGDQGYMLRVGLKDVDEDENAGVVANFNIGGLAVDSYWNELWSDEGVLSLNTWHHLANVYDGSSMKIYVDGVEIASRMADMEIGPALKQPLLIGDSPMWPGRSFNGLIDEVRIWNVARTYEQIFKNKDKEISQADDLTGLVAYYRFNFDTKDQTGINNAELGDTDAKEDIDPTWVAKGAPIASGGVTGIKEIVNNKGQLHQNQPNPVLETTRLLYTLNELAFVSIRIIDITGKEIISKVNMKQEIGEYSVEVDMSEFVEGIYLYQLKLDNNIVSSKKMIVH